MCDLCAAPQGGCDFVRMAAGDPFDALRELQDELRQRQDELRTELRDRQDDVADLHREVRISIGEHSAMPPAP